MIKLLLLYIDIIYFENKYEDEVVPMKKYRYWESLNKCYKLLEEVE